MFPRMMIHARDYRKPKSGNTRNASRPLQDHSYIRNLRDLFHHRNNVISRVCRKDVGEGYVGRARALSLRLLSKARMRVLKGFDALNELGRIMPDELYSIAQGELFFFE